MIRDITIGQYYPADSIIHRLDPRTKIIATVVYLFSLFLYQSILGYGLALLCLITVVQLAKVPWSFILKGMKPILFLLLFTVSFNLFLTNEGPVLVRLGSLTITQGGLSIALFMGARLSLLIAGSNIMTLTTTPNSLTDGLERLLRPLKVIKVPVHEIAMMMAIALRFIPILLEETDKIMKAQVARGADLESGNLVKKAKAMIPVLVPLFVSAFRRAIDLAMAMEARCYQGGVGRTKMYPLQYKKRDISTYLCLICYIILITIVSI